MLLGAGRELARRRIPGRKLRLRLLAPSAPRSPRRSASSGNTLYTTGSGTSLTTKDNGLAPNSVPLGPAAAPLVGLALLALGLRHLRARRH